MDGWMDGWMVRWNNYNKNLGQKAFCGESLKPCCSSSMKSFFKEQFIFFYRSCNKSHFFTKYNSDKKNDFAFEKWRGIIVNKYLVYKMT